jgi:polyhydroxybutyrate depolymerase
MSDEARFARTRRPSTAALLITLLVTLFSACDAPLAPTDAADPLRSTHASTSPARDSQAAPPGRAASDTPPNPVDLALPVLHVPDSARTKPRPPFVLLLHGLGDSGENLARGLGLERTAQSLGVAYAAPDGAVDRNGQRHWNAAKACCDFFGLGVDHSRLLGELPSRLGAQASIELGEVVAVGFSNGSFMAQRLACDDDRVRAIVAIAGAAPAPVDRPCTPKHPVRVVVVHGDRDRVVPYEGGPLLRDARRVVASARETARFWATQAHCNGEPRSAGERDYVERLAGAETVVESFDGCDAPVELWTVRGADHVGVLSPVLVEAALARALGR